MNFGDIESVVVICNANIGTTESEVNSHLNDGFEILTITHHNGKVCFVMGLKEEEEEK